jgi:hypothetical protein
VWEFPCAEFLSGAPRRLETGVRSCWKCLGRDVERKPRA